MFLFYSSDHAFVKNSVNDLGNSTNLIKRNLGQSGNGQCLEMAKNLPQLRNVEVKMSCQCWVVCFKWKYQGTEIFWREAKYTVALEDKGKAVIIRFTAETNRLQNCAISFTSDKNELIHIFSQQLRKSIVLKCNTLSVSKCSIPKLWFEYAQ